MKYILVILLNLFSLSNIFTQNLNCKWNYFVGGTGIDYGAYIEVDHQGNSFICGVFSNSISLGGYPLESQGKRDIFITKVDSSGQILWAKHAGGVNEDTASSIALDEEGNAYITGSFRDTAIFDNQVLVARGYADIYIAKYNNTGNLEWVIQEGGTGYDNAGDIKVDHNKSIYISGNFSDTILLGEDTLTELGNKDFFVAKYDSLGQVLWGNQAGSLGTDDGLGVDVDGTGNVYVCGYVEGNLVIDDIELESYGDFDIFIVKYDLAGDIQWAKIIGGSGFDAAADIAVDEYGNVHFAGVIEDSVSFGPVNLTSNGNWDAFLAKLDPDGNVLWANQGGGQGIDGISDIVLDQFSNIFITGWINEEAVFDGDTITTIGGDDILIAKYDASGNRLLVEVIGGPGGEQAYGIASHESGKILITGQYLNETNICNGEEQSRGSSDILFTMFEQNKLFTAKVVCDTAIAQGCMLPVQVYIDLTSQCPPDHLLGSFTGLLKWDPSQLAYEGPGGLNTQFTGFTNLDSLNGKLLFNGINSAGVEGQVDVLTGVFKVIGEIGVETTIDLDFTALTTANTFTNLLPNLIIEDCSVSILPENLLGDVNNDQVINSTDALFILSYDTGIPIPSVFLGRIIQGIGDVNQDAQTNSTDALAILSYEIGLDVPYPVGLNYCIDPDLELGSNQETVIYDGHDSIQVFVVARKFIDGNYSEAFNFPISVDLVGKNQKLGSYTGTISWDPSHVRLLEFKGGSTNGYENPVINDSLINEGKLVFAHAQPNAKNGLINIINLKFAPLKSISKNEISIDFSSMTTADNYTPLIPVVSTKPTTAAQDGNTVQSLLTYPNPFAKKVNIEYQLSKRTKVECIIFDILGRKIKTVFSDLQLEGQQVLNWDGKDEAGIKCNSGVYLIVLKANKTIIHKKVILETI